MNRATIQQQLQKLTVLAAILLVAACDAGFVDSEQSLGDYDSRSVVLGDVDADGDLDMVVANQNQGNRIYFNDGDGSFTDSGQSLDEDSSQSVALADIDGDGDLDMVVANQNQANLIYLNDGLGNFSDSGQALAENDSYSVALADIELDGDIDMVVANQGQANIITSMTAWVTSAIPASYWQRTIAGRLRWAMSMATVLSTS